MLRQRPMSPYDYLPEVPSFTVTSDDVTEGKQVEEPYLFNGFGLSGGNLSPHLRWEGAPAETRSFAVTMYDPDAPTGSGFWHWVLYDIPADVTELPTGAASGSMEGLPKGATHARNDYGTKDYGGPAAAPGTGVHRYIFAVHALDIDHLEVPPEVTPPLVGFNLTFHTIARAVMETLYGQ
jgi:Raf kinase inhibitor-like YbhB/YbcL family protein